MLDETAEHDEERRAQQAEAVRLARDVTDESAEHDGFAQHLRIVGDDPCRRHQITRTRRAAGAKHRVGSPAAEAPDCNCREHRYCSEGHQRDQSSAQQEIMDQNIGGGNNQK